LEFAEGEQLKPLNASTAWKMLFY